MLPGPDACHSLDLRARCLGSQEAVTFLKQSQNVHMLFDP